MYTIMVCENNLQPTFCCLDHKAMEWPGPEGPQEFGTGQYRYPSICSNIPEILLEEYNVYNYDLWKQPTTNPLLLRL